VVLNVCGRVGLALGQACFLQSSGQLVLVWQASASSVAAASGSFRVDPALRGGVGVGSL